MAADKTRILAATDGGRAVIEHYYPQSARSFEEGGRRNFKIRPDDKNPSCCVFRAGDSWLIQDKGGSDTKAKNCFTLVCENEGLGFPQACDWIAARFAPELLGEGEGWKAAALAKPDIETVAGQPSLTVHFREGGKFTDKELSVLGFEITQEVCDSLCLRPLDYYVTKEREGQSRKVCANDSYPIYCYDYGCWGKIYQPLGKSEYRFTYFGQKPADFFFGEREFMRNYALAKEGKFQRFVDNPDYQDPSEQDDPDNAVPSSEPEKLDMQWKSLVICSGPSDALNVRNAGYHVCWLNSETAELNEYEYSLLTLLAKKIYILYDIDETGIKNMRKIALKYLDISMIVLPSELRQLKDRRGKSCKDAKDFFMYFRKPEIQNPRKLFDGIVRLSGGLKFWTDKYSRDGKVFLGYDINNEQMYSFLEAAGFHRIATSTTRSGLTYCHIRDNVVTLIDEEAITATCRRYLLDYLTEHPQYYTQGLVNAIYRSPQITKAGLENLDVVEPDFNAYDRDTDYFFFRNCVARVTKDGIETMRKEDCPYMVYSSKIIDHDFRVDSPYFDISMTDEYAAKRNRLSSAAPASPEIKSIRKEIDALTDSERYRLSFLNKDGGSFMQYVWDTGRDYWRKEEAWFALTKDEADETRLNFMSKTLALGYMLTKFKNAGQPYAVYAMEMEQSEEGEHLGGTGKSLFFNSIEKLRKQVYIDAQMMDEDKMQFLFQGVERGVTDTIFMDDLNNRINLHKFMNMITGKMVINVKHASGFTLDYKDSPKIAWTSNHAIRNFDASLNRRIWFAAFSDYYHSDSPQRRLTERSPYTKFGKNLIQDYSPDEMNKFYNFMLYCVASWKKIRVRVQPPMKSIIRRTLQKAMSDEFLFWAQEYFCETRLNCYVDRDEAFEAYRDQLSKTAASLIRPNSFKRKVMDYCAYNEWTFNPPELLLTETEKARNDIRKKVGGDNRYYFYIDTHGKAPKGSDLPPDPPLPGGAGDEDDDGGFPF